MSTDRFATWGAQSRAGFIDQQVVSGSMPVQEARAYAEREFAKLLPAGLESPGHYLWCAYDGDVEVGTLWVGMTQRPAGISAFVYDFSVAADARRRGYGRAIMMAGEGEARSRGAVSMRLNVFGHNTGAYRLYETLGYAVTAISTTRRLDASRQPERPDEPMLRLEPLTQVDFDAYRVQAEEDYARLLPQGLSTPERFLWTAYDGELEVAMIWLNIMLKSDGLHAFGYAFLVKGKLRRHDYGRAIIVAVEQICRDRGVVSVGLNVFGPNHGSRSLYEQAGFRVTAMLMAKSLR